MSESVILIAEDDAEDRFIMTEGFRSFNQHDSLRFFDHGVAMLEYLEQELTDDVALIVLDLNMPLMNGTDTLRELKRLKERQHIPVIILSTSDNEIERSACYELGVKDYKIKPPKFEAYLELCRELYQITGLST